jgi:hypothetical protein
MGTGKTRAALTISENFKVDKVVVIAPEGLQKTWKDEKHHWKADLPMVYCSYENLVHFSRSNDIKSACVIVDECHNLWNLKKNISNSSFASAFRYLIYPYRNIFGSNT